MLRLHRPLHFSIRAAGHLTTGLSVSSMPNTERSMQVALSTVLLPVAVPVTQPSCPPTSPLPMLGWLPCVEAVLSPLPLACLPDLRGVPRRYIFILFD